MTTSQPVLTGFIIFVILMLGVYPELIEGQSPVYADARAMPQTESAICNK